MAQVDDGKRKFLYWGAGLVSMPLAAAFLTGAFKKAGSIAVETVASELPQMVTSTTQYFTGALDPYSDVARELGGRLFCGLGDSLAVVPASDNPNARYVSFGTSRFTYPTAYAARCAQNLMGDVIVKEASNVEVSHMTGRRILVLGSPESNTLSRSIFGNFGEFFLSTGKHGDLGIRFPIFYGKAKTQSGDQEFRYNGKDDAKIDAHALYMREGNKVTQRKPNIENGRLREDFLLISSVPNFSSVDDLKRGYRIVNIAGTHRFGTMALDILLRNEWLLHELNRKIAHLNTENRGWQVILRVDRIDIEKQVPISLFSHVEEHAVDAPYLDLAAEMDRVNREGQDRKLL